jgi:hypothetical protein
MIVRGPLVHDAGIASSAATESNAVAVAVAHDGARCRRMPSLGWAD